MLDPLYCLPQTSMSILSKINPKADVSKSDRIQINCLIVITRRRAVEETKQKNPQKTTQVLVLNLMAMSENIIWMNIH